MSVYPSCTRKQFMRTITNYCNVFGFKRPGFSTRENLWGIYKQDINRNCHEDVSIDIAQFLDQHHSSLEKEKMLTNTVSVGCTGSYKVNSNTYDLCIIDDIIPCAPKACEKLPWNKKKEEENSMTTNPERDYLRRELNNIKYRKDDDLEKTFRIHSTGNPKTYDELIAAIKDGKYEIDTKAAKIVDARKAADEFIPWGPMYGIKFKLDDAPDHDGHHKAYNAMKVAFTTAERIIMTADAAAGLKALNDFEAWTPAN